MCGSLKINRFIFLAAGPPVVSDEVFKQAVEATAQHSTTEVAYNIQTNEKGGPSSVFSVLKKSKVFLKVYK